MALFIHTEFELLLASAVIALNLTFRASKTEITACCTRRFTVFK